MSKIVKAVNSMISNAEKISDVVILKYPDNNDYEYVFKYDFKYIWGISNRGEDYSLFFYPEIKEVNKLNPYMDWNSVEYITYNTKDLKTRETLESFAELYLIIKEKLHNVDGVLDDIIGDLE